MVGEWFLMKRLENVQGCINGLRANSANAPLSTVIPWPLRSFYMKRSIDIVRHTFKALLNIVQTVNRM